MNDFTSFHVGLSCNSLHDAANLKFIVLELAHDNHFSSTYNTLLVLVSVSLSPADTRL